MAARLARAAAAEGQWQNKMKSALIIFVRNPILGKVKTRLAATMGNEKALAIYKFLLQHTKAIVENTTVKKFIFYANDVNDNDLWDGYKKKLQLGNDLGERMHNAFAALFESGFKKVCIIGSDCYELTPEIINTAFKKLDTASIVIGPATDGGYYLLGMQAPLKNIFENISWSSEQVFAQTKKIIEQHRYSLSLLPVLNDVDEEKDITFAF
jgi:uncharacterized protein